MARTYQPTARNLIIRRSTSPLTNADGEAIAATSLDIGPFEGVVLACGPGASIQLPQCDFLDVGYRVVFSRFERLERHPDHDILLVEADEIRAVIVDSPDEAARESPSGHAGSASGRFA